MFPKKQLGQLTSKASKPFRGIETWMNSRRIIFIFHRFGCHGPLAIIVLANPREPHYQGGHCPVGLQQCQRTALDEIKPGEAQSDFLCLFRSKKLLPRLLDLVEAKDDPIVCG